MADLFWPGEDPIGRPIRIGGAPSPVSTIVGIVGDVRSPTVGIYGVVAYVVSQRTREIGVRIALGASQREVVRLMLWQGLRPAAAGVVLGVIVALPLGRAASALLYTVRPTDPATLVGVTAVLMVVVVVASLIPAMRASSVPPAESLRGE